MTNSEKLTTCLARQDLLDYLNERVDETSESKIQAHLNECESCRQLLEQAAAQPQIWDGLRQHLTQDFASPLVSTESLAEEAERKLTRLKKLLNPTDDPNMLGRIGTYEVVGLIGEGSTGVVLKAFEPALRRFVAIKLLLPHLAESGPARRRFEREGRAVAAVAHEHVVPVYAVDSHQGVPFIVMQYIAGKSLHQRDRDIGATQYRRSHSNRSTNRKRARCRTHARHRPSRCETGKHFT